MDQLPEPLRRRLDAVFGQPLPDTTSDERGQDDPPATDRDDEQLLADRPPHHDRER